MQLAQPWWVNLLFFVPVICYFSWRANGLAISRRRLAVTAFFGTAFGYVEACVVVYLRAIIGILPDSSANVADVVNLSSPIYQNAYLLGGLPRSLLAVEIVREVATMAMLLSVAWLTTSATRDRCAIFLWVFAVWDIFYYVGLWVSVGWPSSLLAPDVLFLIPVPWFGQVWLPIVISALTLLAVALNGKNSGSGSLQRGD